MTFTNKVEKYVTEKELIGMGDRVLCALSGGGDSVALLHTLKALESRLGFTLTAAHFNHGIRGDEADRDEAFSRELCRELNIPFFSIKEDIPAAAKASGEGLEECARKRRYAFLFRVADEQKCNRIATAHHATDNTETVLFHLIRGTGINGLGGIAPKRDDGVIRPLLCVSRAEIDVFLSESGFGFVTDSTNTDTDMTRNFIRLKMLPLIREINPTADKAVSRLSDSAREDEEYFIEEAKKLPKNAPLSLLKDTPTPILKRYLRLLFDSSEKQGGQLDYERTTEICQRIKSGDNCFRYSLPGGVAIVADRKSLEFIRDKYTPAPFEITVTQAGEYETECGAIFVTENEEKLNAWLSEQKAKGRKNYRIAYPYGGEFAGFTARSRREGDKYLRGGMHRAVRKELNSIGYPAHKRDSLPCFCDGDGIFWIPPLKAGDKVSGTAVQNSKQLIYIGYTEN